MKKTSYFEMATSFFPEKSYQVVQTLKLYHSSGWKNEEKIFFELCVGIFC